MGLMHLIRKSLNANGLRGLYRGFGISILTYAPSNVVWWASYSVAHRLIWGGLVATWVKRIRVVADIDIETPTLAPIPCNKHLTEQPKPPQIRLRQDCRFWMERKMGGEGH
jgi:hypothetical protein